MWFSPWLDALRVPTQRQRSRPKKRPADRPRSQMRRLLVEGLEDRRLLAFVLAADDLAGASPVAADFNNDGRLELATVTSDQSGSTISVVLGKGDGTFQQPAQTSPTGLGSGDGSGPFPQSLAVGHFNDDSSLDLAIAVLDYEGFDNDVRILLGNGDGTFDVAASETVTPGYLSNHVATGDLDADGRMDLVITSSRDPYEFLSEAAVSIRRGRDDGTFAHAATYASSDIGLQFFSPVLADFNRDGSVDVAVPAMSMPPGTQSFFLRVFLGNGDGTLRWSRDVACDPIDSAAVGDFNMDGKADVVGTSTLGGDTIALLLGNGDGSFQAARRVANTAMPFAPGDVNGDSRLDLVTVSGGDLNVYLGNGDGTFAPPVAAATGATHVNSVVLADFNADGRPDAVVSNGDTGAVSVMLNDGDWFPPPAPPPALRIGDVTITERNTGTVAASFIVTLTAASTETVTVAYATGDGTATAASDYSATSGILTFAPGEISKPISVLVIGDRLAEPTEAFVVNLSSPTNATIADGQGVGTILDDEPRISVNDVTVTEGNTGSVNAVFTVSLSHASDEAVTVAFATANGTAGAGSDYTAASGNVTVPAGQLSRTFTIAVKGDRLAEPNETFFVNLSSPTGATIADGQGVGTIVDNEPRISISDVSKSEGRKGNTTLFTFTVTLSAAYDQPVTMLFRTVNGTATTSKSDYIAKTGTLTFAPGETTKTITIEVKGDNKREANETFYLDLFGNSSNSSFAKSRGIGTILNDD